MVKIPLIRSVLPGFIIILFMLSSGCLDGDDDPEEVNIKISGSTTVFPIGQAAANSYMQENEHVNIIISGGGSGVGIKDVAAGSSDIGMASRALKDSEKAIHPKLVATRIGDDGLSIVVNEDNPVHGISMAQLKSIYTGEITNWYELGWENETIKVVGRDEESGTRGAFDDLVLDDEVPTSSMMQKSSNGLVFTEVKHSRYAIGYIGLGYVDAGVKALEMEGIYPSVETVQDGSYPISRPLNLVTLGAPEGDVKEFIDYVTGEEGQSIVSDQDFVPIS